MNLTMLAGAISMGFLGSLHCAGMCGPIMLILPLGERGGARRVLGISLYHFGRISVYAAMGALVFLFHAAFQPQWQQYVSITLGAVLLLAGLLSFLGRGRTILPAAWTGFIRMRLSAVMRLPGPAGLLLAGMLNGALPCGLVYMALAMAAAAHTVGEAVALLYGFGLGTVPMLLSVLILRRRLPGTMRTAVVRLVPILMLAFGSIFLLRGMNLGIPLLSPSVEMSGATIKSSCCHKP